jgi:DNA-binding Lrp family transcriptional regulator
VRFFDKVKHLIDELPQTAMQRLDDLDVRIMKELGSPSSVQWNVRESYASIAKRVGVDEETVRRRLKRAEERGVLPGWRMMMNPHVIDCEAACLDLEVEDEERKEKAVTAVSRVEGVIKILDFRGRGLQITLYYPNQNALQRKTELICSICGFMKPTVWELEFPRSRIRMTSMDWKIVSNMLDDARKSLNDVSKLVGLSTRTVERRLTTMQEEFVLYLQGTPGFRAFAGLSCVYLVHIPDAKKKNVVDRAVLSKRRIEISNTASREYSTFVMLFDNPSEADDMTKWIAGLEGVDSVKMGIMKDLIVVQDWLRDEIVKRSITSGSSR